MFFHYPSPKRGPLLGIASCDLIPPRARGVGHFLSVPGHQQSVTKIFETSFSFRVKGGTGGKSLIAIFRAIFAIVNKIFILARGLGAQLSFYQV